MEQIPLPPSFPANVNSFLSYLEKKANANVHQVLSAVQVLFEVGKKKSD